MVDQKSNAQVLNGVNDDILEMKSLTTLRKRVVTDGEVVSKSQNAFRLAGSKTGVILRNDGNDFHTLVTPEGQAQDGQWNTLRPLSFNLKNGRVALRNGVDISGGAMVSHNAGVFTTLTGPDALINGQTYDSAPMYTDFKTGSVVTRMLMGLGLTPVMMITVCFHTVTGMVSGMSFASVLTMNLMRVSMLNAIQTDGLSRKVIAR